MPYSAMPLGVQFGVLGALSEWGAERDDKEWIVQKKGYILVDNACLVVEALKKSAVLSEEVKDGVLKAGVIVTLYEAEQSRWKWNDGLPTMPQAWVRGVLGSVLGGVAGAWLGIFAASIGIGAPLAIGAVLGAVMPNPNATVGRGQLGAGIV